MDETVDFVIEHYNLAGTENLTLEEKIKLLEENNIRIVYVPPDEEEDDNEEPNVIVSEALEVVPEKEPEAPVVDIHPVLNPEPVVVQNPVVVLEDEAPKKLEDKIASSPFNIIINKPQKVITLETLTKEKPKNVFDMFNR